MRIRFDLPDGGVLTWGGRQRYAVFRLTQQGGYVVMSGNQEIQAMVQFAKKQHDLFGWRFVVLDTVESRAIASYPTIAELHG